MKLYAYIRNNSLYQYDCLLQDLNGDLQYSTFVNFMRVLALDPSKYTPHACRKGGTTNMHICGADMLQIQLLGKWDDLNSLQTCVKKENRDLARFVDPI